MWGCGTILAQHVGHESGLKIHKAQCANTGYVNHSKTGDDIIKISLITSNEAVYVNEG